jgi:hypothetical protein
VKRGNKVLFDVYSTIPLPIIYFIGIVILMVILWSLLRDAARAEPETRKKLVKVIAGLIVGSIVLVGGLSYFKVSERLFPSFYEHEEQRKQLNELNPWEENYNPEDWQRPFNSDGH